MCTHQIHDHLGLHGQNGLHLRVINAPRQLLKRRDEVVHLHVKSSPLRVVLWRGSRVDDHVHEEDEGAERGVVRVWADFECGAAEVGGYVS